MTRHARSGGAASMPAIVIDSGPIEAADHLRDVPQGKWRDLMLARRQFMEIRLAHDCRCLVEFVNDAQVMHAALGFASAEAMIHDGYGLEPVEIATAVQWLKLREPDAPVSLNQAIALHPGEVAATKRADKARLVVESFGDATNDVVRRTLDDLPEDLSPFAREVAILTLHRAVQARVLQPIMAALEKLEARTDWSGGHLVIENYSQTWRNAPFKHYTSFEDFYAMELESTWGKWTDLQETWKARIDGRISEQEKDARIAEDARKARAERYRQVDAKAPELKEPHRPNKRYTKEKDVTLKDRGNANTYAIAKLRKDAPAIHARVLAGEFSAHAGMIEAGFRKKAPSRKQTPFELISKLLPKLTDDELDAVHRLISRARDE
jgi:hypothetical protein